MAELGQQTVELSTLVSRAAEESYVSLKELVEVSKSPELSDSERKIGLLKFLVKTQQRMLRLNVLAKWCQQVPLIQYCQKLQSTLSSHDMCFTQAADSLFFMHEGLQQARAPIHDVPSAIEVLLNGSYGRMPKCVEDVGIQGTLTEDQQKPALKKLDALVRSKLLEVSLPKEISQVKVSDGTALLQVNGEFKTLVTLGYRGNLSLWRILHLELLVGEKSGPFKLEELRRHALGDDLERRMAATENPFTVLYSVLRELCVALIMDTVIRQVQALRLGRWKDAVRFELISDGSFGPSQANQDGEADSAVLRTPGLKIVYWLDLDKNSGASDSGTCPFIKVEPGPDLQIRCTHSSFIIDPLSGREAELSLDPSCIDIESLLLRAIYCNKYTRLLEIQKELEQNVQICHTAGDVLLWSFMEDADTNRKVRKECESEGKQYEGQEVLRVRAYGSSYFTLGINIRNGSFLLRSSENILMPSVLTECEEVLNQGSKTAAEVVINLRTKSILHLFASIGKFLSLEVYEHGLPAVRLPKEILNGSAMLLMGFPDFGCSYFLLLQLDKEFKPLFRLMETQSDSPAKTNCFNDSTNVIRLKEIDINQMQLLEDEPDLSLLNGEKLSHLLPDIVGDSQTSEHVIFSELSLQGSTQISGFPSSSFSSVVDEVFELDKGVTSPSVPLHSLPSMSATHFGSAAMNLHSMKAGVLSPKWEAANSASKLSNINSHQNGSLYVASNIKGPIQSNSFSSLSSSLLRSTAAQRLSASKSEQDLSSLKSPHSVEVSFNSSMDEDHTRLLNDSLKYAQLGTRASRLVSPTHQANHPRVPNSNIKSNGPGSSPTGPLSGSPKVAVSSPLATSPVFQGGGVSATTQVLGHDAYKYDKNPRRCTISDILSLIPSLQNADARVGFSKRRKISDSAHFQSPSSQALVSSEVRSSEAYSCGNLIAEANKGNVPSSIYVSTLLHVVKHCSLCIKHARLTSQMEALDIPYVEEVGSRNASSNIWFRLPVSRSDSWQHICLRLGRPGSMYWDVKINDQHFRDLWELQKGSSSTPWGSGVRIASSSELDSHIRYDPEGVVISYRSVEADSIKELVADIQRLSNARMFALGMRKLLGVRTHEKPEEGTASSDNKLLGGGKGFVQGADKLSEQMRRAFKIEAVGLMSLWFSFGSGILARFVVEWELGKEGCTMHVSPDQLWPHTKFLEDFINGGEVSSLLDCIRLTAGPLHALAAATRPARAGPSPGIPGMPAAVSSMPKHAGYAQSQGLLPNSSSVASQPTSGPPGNNITSSGTGPLGNHILHGSGILNPPSRGGPGIVPSSLLPIDVSVVLRGPYWIRIIYRKHFAVDMRCYAGDQVWLQPATPPKDGPSSGGSLPCPQFRPFIMEHVAQELNGLDPSFAGGQQAGGPTNANSSNPSSGSLLASANGNRVNVPSSAAMSRAANQVAASNRVGNAVPGSSSMAAVSAGLPVRKSLGGNVPAHVRGELNTAIIGLGDDGGYGGGWVPLVALKKVLRGTLKYLGVLWLFAQLPSLLQEILGSILKGNEGALLNLDHEQPALRFFVGGYVFAVSVHRVQLLLQVLSVKKFHHQQQQQQQNAGAQEELSQSEIYEICDYFSRRVASEPYDASRVASFITLLTLPISVLREFLKLILWKRGLSQVPGGEIAAAQKTRIELCLENHSGLSVDNSSENSSVAKSNIHHDRTHNSVDFALTLVLDSAHIPHVNAAGGAAWLPYCVSVRLRYSFGETATVTLLGMEGSHGGRACWLRDDDWEKCRQRVARTVEVSGSSPGDPSQGRLRIVADSVQRTLNLCLQALRESSGATASSSVI